MPSLPAQETAPSPLLEVRGLNVAFQGGGYWHPAVHDLSFSVNPGETLAIVGESGSGKSVTSLAVMGLLDRARSRVTGQIRFDGQDLLALDERAMRRIRGGKIAMIFQEPMTSLNPVMTIGQQMTEAIRIHTGLGRAEAEAEAARALDRVRIANAKGALRSYPHNFSGGMRQRVMIAMALAARSRLLIADEPTTALDVTVQGQILDLIKDLQDEVGTAVLFITHDMGVVAEISDRTLVMWRGNMIEEGRTAGILGAPASDYARALMSAVPQLGALRDEPAPVTFPEIDPATGTRVEAEPMKPAPAGVKPVLEVEGLVKIFGDRAFGFGRRAGLRAVDDVSFSIAPGETLSLVGESGSGKSTTGRALMQLIEPDEGRIMLNGSRFDTLSHAQARLARRDVQMIFQDPFASFNPRRNMLQSICEPFVEHGLGSRKLAAEKAAHLMTAVGLDPRMLARYPHAFSGGQRQRLSIARALMLDPKVIIADESVSALDVIVKAQVCNLLMKLQEDLGLSYLFITHDMAVVERISHRVAVMRKGRIVEIGPRQGLLANPAHPYTRRLIASVPRLDATARFERSSARLGDGEAETAASGTYREVAPAHFVLT